jgi:hypothetical protein
MHTAEKTKEEERRRKNTAKANRDSQQQEHHQWRRHLYSEKGTLGRKANMVIA